MLPGSLDIPLPKSTKDPNELLLENDDDPLELRQKHWNKKYWILYHADGSGFFFSFFFFFFKCYLPVDPERHTDLCFFSLRVNPIVGEK